MTILRRLAAWFVEIVLEALLIGCLLVILSGPSKSSLVNDVLFAAASTAVVFMVGSGYLFTSAIFGVAWRSQRWWLYPAIAAALFVIHVQCFATGWKLSFRAQVEAIGALIVFACTVAGGYCLRNWSRMLGSHSR
jgi:hypothetical protein